MAKFKIVKPSGINKDKTNHILEEMKLAVDKLSPELSLALSEFATACFLGGWNTAIKVVKEEIDNASKEGRASFSLPELKIDKPKSTTKMGRMSTTNIKFDGGSTN